MKIRWIGAFNHSGFGIESIGMCTALKALGHEVHCVISTPPHVAVEGIDGLKECFGKRDETWPDRTVIHAMPPPLDVKVDVLWLNYEFTPLPDAWRYTLDHANVLLAESLHAKSCFESITNRPISIVPSGIETTFGDNFKGTHIFKDNEFAFLSVLEWVPRKQPCLLINAFCEAFRDDPAVYLFIKATRGALGNPRAEIPKITAEYPGMKGRVVYVDQHISDMGMLYPAFDGYVLPSALEGWGITFMEAIACGIKPVCPAVGGNAMFCTAGNSYPVACGEWEPAAVFGEGLFHPEAKWRVPDKEDLIRNMQRAVADRSRLSPEDREAFKAKWSWENAAKKLLEAME